MTQVRMLAEGRRHDHHAVAGAMPLAGAASASLVDLPLDLVSTGRLERPRCRLGGGGSVQLSYVEMASRAGFEPAFPAPLRCRDLEDRAGYRDVEACGRVERP